MARTSLAHRAKMPPFVGHLRNQEASRKLIVRDLLREASECERRAANARKLASKAATVESLRDKRLLGDIVNLGASGPQYWVAKLFGVTEQLWKVEEGGSPYREPRRQFLIHCVEGYNALWPGYLKREAAMQPKPSQAESAGARVEPFPENVIEFPLTAERRYELAKQRTMTALDNLVSIAERWEKQ